MMNNIKRFVYEVDFNSKILIKAHIYEYDGENKLVSHKEKFIGKYYGTDGEAVENLGWDFSKWGH